ncbi:bifunctional phosphoribosyl-AMP cyclohydrolase/phosphoribosyl-ATP diphosphatase HisIE [Sphingomonas mesophila]|uniref:bifunctional phosphoribosyl-AMP cyclohydrolase/phosphoribosyl-ATP diphosphatase HisIE n=1 Tax=Sphingomonas mesophila TaxID=2303576 RepID=UPI000E58EF0A|nr:bifunctional phosphoribosyl-AMP cyclohydrolase/phosphoribosyl-ATP diphosphatase HisIE [Sphingomonas mesophila]
MIDPATLDWNKSGGLIPAVIQDAASGEVRMVGMMDRAALEATLRDGFVTFFSRSKNRLWRKGESSGNLLDLVDLRTDCDRDSLLVLAQPRGPTCHTGAASCFGEGGAPGTGFLASLAAIVDERTAADPAESYTARLVAAGVKRIAQKFGEEGVEVALAAAGGDAAEVTAEAADLLYHLTVLLRETGSSWAEVTDELRRRHASSATAAS